MTTFMTTYILILLLFYFIAPAAQWLTNNGGHWYPHTAYPPTGTHKTLVYPSIQRLAIRGPSISEPVFTSSGDEEERVEQENGVYNHKSLCFFSKCLFSSSFLDGTGSASRTRGGGTIYIISSLSLQKFLHLSKAVLHRTGYKKIKANSTSLTLCHSLIPTYPACRRTYPIHPPTPLKS